MKFKQKQIKDYMQKRKQTGRAFGLFASFLLLIQASNMQANFVDSIARNYRSIKRELRKPENQKKLFFCIAGAIISVGGIWGLIKLWKHLKLTDNDSGFHTSVLPFGKTEFPVPNTPGATVTVHFGQIAVPQQTPLYGENLTCGRHSTLANIAWNRLKEQNNGQNPTEAALITEIIRLIPIWEQAHLAAINTFDEEVRYWRIKHNPLKEPQKNSALSDNRDMKIIVDLDAGQITNIIDRMLPENRPTRTLYIRNQAFDKTTLERFNVSGTEDLFDGSQTDFYRAKACQTFAQSEPGTAGSRLNLQINSGCHWTTVILENKGNRTIDAFYMNSIGSKKVISGSNITCVINNPNNFEQKAVKNIIDLVIAEMPIPVPQTSHAQAAIDNTGGH